MDLTTDVATLVDKFLGDIQFNIFPMQNVPITGVNQMIVLSPLWGYCQVFKMYRDNQDNIPNGVRFTTNDFHYLLQRGGVFFNPYPVFIRDLLAAAYPGFIPWLQHKAGDRKINLN